MAKKTDHLADFETDDSGGVLSNLLAEEGELDRRALWRLGSWGVGATAAVILAVMANQSSLGLKREQVAAADITRQGQQIQLIAKETQNEARRLAAAIDTLNSDRDRLYSRVTSLEQGLDSVTGTIARQGSASASPSVANAEPQAAQNPPPSPAVATVATAPATAPVTDRPTSSVTTAEPAPAAASSVAKDAAKTDAAKAESAKSEAKPETAKADAVKPEPARPSPATPLVSAQSMMAPPDPAAGKLIEPGKTASSVIASPIPDVVALAPSETDSEADEAAPIVSLQRTEFGVDLGTANSVNGLRALWRGLLKSRSNAPLTALRPIIVIKESTNGLGMQLRLVAGPLNDAGAAAKICAVLTENNRPCETAIFDGQRLSLKSDDPPPTAAKPMPRRRVIAKRAAVVVEDVSKKPEAPPVTTPAPAQTTLSTIFGRKNTQ
ncbi:hypothetical protein [Bradyrhizobium valentinum]|uniref:SPOR domain-containing protein n=1 Tax=Bradyrhizobium valentinum TaxID=1518501 RepID=A0A0R3LQ55_9BRAD|nr:hypothetical protein [Bradyrhizobium valentinum]KRQ94873.1 hypothetical protein CQ10_33780 [Bradyrhizobium valentinum]KRR10056.1 hypothetical protein CP49_41425 [Bradyrhizobium valentinum]